MECLVLPIVLVVRTDGFFYYPALKNDTARELEIDSKGARTHIRYGRSDRKSHINEDGNRVASSIGENVSRISVCSLKFIYGLKWALAMICQ